jgi:hypothetical protein
VSALQIRTAGGASTVTVDGMKKPKYWFFMLCLVYHFCSLDSSDVIYGLRKLMTCSNQEATRILEPNCNKPAVEVYPDSVEAVLMTYENTDALLYLSGDDSPS